MLLKKIIALGQEALEFTGKQDELELRAKIRALRLEALSNVDRVNLAESQRCEIALRFVDQIFFDSRQMFYLEDDGGGKAPVS